MNALQPRKIIFTVAAVLVVALLAWFGWKKLHADGDEQAVVGGNGRIEATEIDVATKYPGRVVDIYAFEGDFVSAGQVLAQMQIDTLTAQRNEAVAQKQQAMTGVASAQAQVKVRESDFAAAQAVSFRSSRRGWAIQFQGLAAFGGGRDDRLQIDLVGGPFANSLPVGCAIADTWGLRKASTIRRVIRSRVWFCPKWTLATTQSARARTSSGRSSPPSSRMSSSIPLRMWMPLISAAMRSIASHWRRTFSGVNPPATVTRCE